MIARIVTPESASLEQSADAIRVAIESVVEEQRLLRVAFEKLVELIAVYAGKPPVPAKRRIHRTPEEKSRIVSQAIVLLRDNGWTTTRIAKELGVNRNIFYQSRAYLEAVRSYRQSVYVPPSQEN